MKNIAERRELRYYLNCIYIMTMYLLNGIDGNNLLQGIYSKEENKMLTFGIGGKFIKEGPVAYRFSKLRELDFVSIINVDNQLEVAYIINGVFNKSPVYADAFELIKWCNIQPSLIFVGKRNCLYQDSLGEVEYNQYMFGFTRGLLNEKALLNELRSNG